MTYYVGYQQAGKTVKIQLSATGKDFFVFHEDMLLTRMRIDCELKVNLFSFKDVMGVIPASSHRGNRRHWKTSVQQGRGRQFTNAVLEPGARLLSENLGNGRDFYPCIERAPLSSSNQRLAAIIQPGTISF
jgi:hypothetical protein